MSDSDLGKPKYRLPPLSCSCGLQGGRSIGDFVWEVCPQCHGSHAMSTRRLIHRRHREEEQYWAAVASLREREQRR